jgi:hypothetical protein
VNEKRKPKLYSERLPARVERADVDAVEALLLELLTEGPMRPRDVKATAAERGLDFADETWQFAKRRLGVKATDLGAGVWTWALPGLAIEDALAAWLDSPKGRFAAYLAQCERVVEDEHGQLTLDVEEAA